MVQNSHIVFSYHLRKNKTSQKLHSLEEISSKVKSKELAWVHLDANKKSTKEWLKKEVDYLDKIIIDALTAQEARPRIIEFNKGLLIILRGLNLDKNEEPQEMASIRIWIDPDRIITVDRRRIKSITDLSSEIDQGKIINNSSEFLYNFIYKIFSNISPYIYALGKKVDLLEENIMYNHNLKMREDLLQVRSKITIFRRYLHPQKDVLLRLKSITSQKWIDDLSLRHFNENYDQISSLIEEIDEARDRTIILHDELSNNLSTKLNKSMYKISLLTAIFLPLTFVTGLLGMNLAGIPGASNENSFYIAATAMILAIIIQYIIFIKNK